MTDRKTGIPESLAKKEAEENHELLRQFYGGEHKSDVCLGEKCAYKACEICPANKTRLMPTDSYRQSIKTGYYSTGICKRINPITGEERYEYVKPGE